MPTQQDIADQLSLSVATVSRALAGHDDRKPETRARVLQMAAQLGYQSSKRATMGSGFAASDEQRHGDAVLLGVFVVMNANGPVPLVTVRLLRGMARACRKTAVALHTEYIMNADEMNRIAEVAHQPATLNQGHMQGVLLLGHFPSDAVRALAEQIPCVRVSINDPKVRLDCIGQAEPDAMAQLFEHLHSMGHQRVGFLGARHPVELARFGAYVQALAERQWPFNPADAVGIVGAPPTEGELSDLVLRQVERGTRAWICGHDDHGYRLVRLLRERGQRVPEDVSVCGFDRLDPPQGLPTLTSIEWPFEEMGAAAVQRMLLRVKTPAGAKREVIFSGSLVKGQSTAPSSPN